MTDYRDAKGSPITEGDLVLGRYTLNTPELTSQAAEKYQAELSKLVFRIDFIDSVDRLYPVHVTALEANKEFGTDMFQFSDIIKVPKEFINNKNQINMFRALAGWDQIG